MFFFPVIFLFMLFYFLLIGGLFFLLKIGLISLAFQKLGIAPDLVFLLLLLILAGSGVNIPVRRLASESLISEQIIHFFGWKFVVPAFRHKNITILAVNLGGAVIPTCLSLFLILKWSHLVLYFLVGILVVTFLVNRVARPIKGVGIATPALFPPFLAALVALILGMLAPSGLEAVPVIAYVSGTLGTLVGADLMNLKKIATLGAPVASIGGAGTFDGVFLTGILAVIFTGF